MRKGARAMSTTYEIQITSNSSHIRSNPKYDKSGANVLGYAQGGEKYTATAVQNGWYKISRKNTNGKTVTGWVYEGAGKEYVKLVKTNTIKKPTANEVNTKPAPAPVKDTTPKKVTNNQTTATVVTPSTQDISNHAIVFSRDEEPSMSGVYQAKSRFIFKDNVTGYEYGSGIDFASSMHKDNYFGEYVDGNGSKSYYQRFQDMYGDIDEAMQFIRETQDIFNIKDRDRLFKEFNRYKLAMPDYHATKTIPYIFFTKPIMHLVDSGGSLTDHASEDPLWKAMYDDEPKNFLGLDGEYRGYDHDFNALLSNAAQSFQASDEVLKTIDHGETYTGWKVVYGRNTNESNTAGQFSIQYVDDHNYNIYKMHKIWVEYINRIYRGHIPNPKVTGSIDNPYYKRFRSHIYKKVLTYPCALYYIVCAADGETILYWSKYYGVFPVNTPASVSSWTHGTPNSFPEFSINYVYSIKEDFHPITLSEFNRHSGEARIYRPLYNPDTHTNTPTMVGAPYVETNRGNGKLEFKLRFRN